MGTAARATGNSIRSQLRTECDSVCPEKPVEADRRHWLASREIDSSAGANEATFSAFVL
jgi:hypothetical protein